MLLVNGHQNFYILKLSELTVTSFIVNIPVKNHLLSFGLVWSQGVCVALEFWQFLASFTVLLILLSLFFNVLLLGIVFDF